MTSNQRVYWDNVPGALREFAKCNVGEGLKPLLLQAADELEQARELLRKCVTTGYSRHEINCFLAGQAPAVETTAPRMYRMRQKNPPHHVVDYMTEYWEITPRPPVETSDALARVRAVMAQIESEEPAFGDRAADWQRGRREVLEELRAAMETSGG